MCFVRFIEFLAFPFIFINVFLVMLHGCWICYPTLAQKHRHERFTATDYPSSTSQQPVFTIEIYTNHGLTAEKPRAPGVAAGSLSLCLVEMLQLWSKDALCLFQCRFARLLPDILRVGAAGGFLGCRCPCSPEFTAWEDANLQCAIKQRIDIIDSPYVLVSCRLPRPLKVN